MGETRTERGARGRARVRVPPLKPSNAADHHNAARDQPTLCVRGSPMRHLESSPERALLQRSRPWQGSWSSYWERHVPIPELTAQRRSARRQSLRRLLPTSIRTWRPTPAS